MQDTEDSASEARPDPADPAPQVRRPRGRKRRMALRVVVLFSLVSVVCAAALAVALWSLLGRPVSAPDWARDRIEAQITASLPGIEVDLGDVSLFVDPEFNPEVSITNLRLRDAATGRGLVTLTRIDAALSRRALLQRRIQPKRIAAQGLFLTLRRERDGSFDLSLGEGVTQTAPDVQTLIADIDRLAESPALADLRALSIDAVTFDYQDARAGRAWVVDGGRLAAERSRDAINVRGDFALLSGGADVTTLTLNARSPIGSTAVSLGLSLDNMPAQDIAAQTPALAWLSVLRAPISGALRTAIDAQGAFQPLNASLQIGAGVLRPDDAASPLPFEAARAYFTYAPASQDFDVTELSVQSDLLRASATGRARLETDPLGALEGLTAQLSLRGLAANPLEIYDAPRSLDTASIDMHLALDPFVLRIGQLSVTAGALTARAEGVVRVRDTGWEVRATARMPQATAPAILGYWPDTLLPGTRRWIADNIRGGTFRNLQTAIRARDGMPPEVYFGTQIEEAELRYVPGMPPITGLSGHLTLEDHRLSVVADRATLTPAQGGTIRADGTGFELRDVRQRGAEAVVSLRTESTITAALSLIDAPPLNLMSRIERPTTLADGRAAVDGRLQFRLIKGLTGDQIDYDIAARLSDVRSDQIVAGRRLAAQSLALSVNPQDGITIAGQGRLDAVPFDGAWSSPLTGPAEDRTGQVRAEIELSERILDTFNIALPPGTMSGQGRGQLDITLPPGGATPSFRLSSDLSGVGLALPGIGWQKAPGTRGDFTLAGRLGQPVAVDRLVLNAPGLDAVGAISLSDAGALSAITFDRLVIGSWLNASGRLVSQGPGAPLRVSLQGGRLDLRSAPFGTGRAGGGSGPGLSGADLALERLQITNTLALTNFRGQFGLGGGLSGDFQGFINGGVAVTGTARQRENGTRFEIDSEDGGRALRDAGLFRDARGGDLNLILRPTGIAGTFDGEIELNRTRIRNAPAMAELLNAISVVGLIDQLNGQGIYFDEVEARFRLTPSEVIITRSSAVGPSMGLSLDGYYDIARKRLDLQGVVSPIYALNILGRVIARKGEGLIGFNFTMRGAADNPQVAVNPLSALTPGMFRDIFRRPPPSVNAPNANE